MGYTTIHTILEHVRCTLTKQYLLFLFFGKSINFIEQTNKTTEQGPKIIQIRTKQNKTSTARALNH